MEKDWKPGDRVVWAHREGVGKGSRDVRSPGVVAATDAGGVHVRFDRDVNGVPTCYATYDELEAEEAH